jgi:hypothetical protein
MPGNAIYRGNAMITNGLFNVKFIVPKDITYGGNNGRISLFFWNEDVTGSGYMNNIDVGGTDTALVDKVGPIITFSTNTQELYDGALVENGSTLAINFVDSISGINIAGAIGHNITLTLDEQKQVVTDFFNYQPGSYTTGNIEFPLTDISEGMHTIGVKAWDNTNNSNEVNLRLTLVPADQLTVKDLLNYPNPFANETDFTFIISRAGVVTIKIYTVAGRLIRVLDQQWADAGFNHIHWDGCDEDGERVANGVYLYKFSASTSIADGQTSTEAVQKLIIIR